MFKYINIRNNKLYAVPYFVRETYIGISAILLTLIYGSGRIYIHNVKQNFEVIEHLQDHIGKLDSLLTLNRFSIFRTQIIKEKNEALSEIVLYADGHFSGFLICKFFKMFDVSTSTLHHGLYSGSDIGSKMMLINSSANTLYSWNKSVTEEYLFFNRALRIVDVSCVLYRKMEQEELLKLFSERKDSPIVRIAPLASSDKLLFFRNYFSALGCNIEWSIHPIERNKLHKSGYVHTPIEKSAAGFCIVEGGTSAVDCLVNGIPIFNLSAYDVPMEQVLGSCDKIDVLKKTAHENFLNDISKYNLCS